MCVCVCVCVCVCERGVALFKRTLLTNDDESRGQLSNELATMGCPSILYPIYLCKPSKACTLIRLSSVSVTVKQDIDVHIICL